MTETEQQAKEAERALEKKIAEALGWRLGQDSEGDYRWYVPDGRPVSRHGWSSEAAADLDIPHFARSTPWAMTILDHLGSSGRHWELHFRPEDDDLGSRYACVIFDGHDPITGTGPTLARAIVAAFAKRLEG